MKKTIAKLVSLMMIVLFLTSCGKADTKAPDNTGATAGDKVVKLGSTGFWCNEDMEPAAGDVWNGWYIGYYGISQQLFKLNEDFNPEPWLALGSEKIDECTWEIELRDDVYFHNGEKMTAESVKNCFERTIKVNERAAAEDWIEGFSAEGQILTVKTSRNIATLPNSFSDPLWVVYYADTEVDYNDGKDYFTGPYVLESFSAFDETVVVKNDNYWGEEPKLDRVHFITIADDESAAMALENGEIDMIYPVNSGAVGAINDNKNIILDTVVSNRGDFLDFNLKHAATGDIAVRRAISMCIDREGFAEKICNNAVTPSYGIYSEALPFGGTDKLDVSIKELDVDGAKKELENAGYKDSNGDGTLDKGGVELDINMIVRSKDTGMINMCEDLSSRLSEIGIKLNITQMENTADTLAAGDYDIASSSYAMAPIGTADYFARLKFKSDSELNYGGFANNEVDSLIKQMEETENTDEINELSYKIQQIILDNVPYVFYAHTNFVVAISDRIVGYENNPTEYYCLDEYLDIKQ